MKLTAQEEYGLRCLLQMAQAPDHFLTVGDIAGHEALSEAYVAKLMRVLRQAGLVRSVRGQRGGFVLTRAPEQILLRDVVEALGGRLFSENFCPNHCGDKRVCVHDVDCSIRALWALLDGAVQRVLRGTVLADLVRGEKAMTVWLRQRHPEVEVLNREP